MKLTKLVIQNYRSYYGRKTFEFSDRLNLILGANGDGKSTFFDALQWVFNTQTSTDDNVPLRNHVSAKMFSELAPGGSGKVSVNAFFTVGNKTRIIEKSFEVEKSLEGKMLTKNFNFVGYQEMASGQRKNVPARDILEKERAFPAVVKKYCLFKGESELNIFSDSETLRKLVELFSDIKDFRPYTAFMDYAEELIATAKSKAQDKATKNSDSFKKLQREIEEKRTKLKSLQERREDYIVTRDECEAFIKAIEENKDTIDLIHNIEDKISSLKIQRENKARELDENYSIKLLDELWILYGFSNIIEEYADKMQDFSQRKQAEIDEYRDQIRQKESDKRALKKVKEQIEKEMASLPWYIPNIRTMRNMIESHRCKVCNTEAPEGSAQYEFMLRRLNEALEKKQKLDDISNTTETPVATKPLFVESIIDDLYQNSNHMSDYDTFIPSLGKTIEEKLKVNKRINDELNDLSAKIEDQQEKLTEILAQSESIGDYNALWHKIRNSIDDKQNAVLNIHDIDEQIPILRREIEEKEEKAGKFAQSREAVMYKDMYEFIKTARTSLDNAETTAMDEFVDKLEVKANEFLNKLNVDDFTGVINIYNDGNGIVHLHLIDKDKRRIDKPNTSLETTMHISILLAISELTKEHLENEYPLIFDAPTSTFDQGKDKDFYETLNSSVEKQCIVVTKSYLNRTDDGEFVVNLDELKGLKADKKGQKVPIYRIKKKSGFDKKDLASIETVVEKIN